MRSIREIAKATLTSDSFRRDRLDPQVPHGDARTTAGREVPIPGFACMCQPTRRRFLPCLRLNWPDAGPCRHLS
jgi:hypothetical protein